MLRMEEITIVSETFKNFLNTGHVCVAFTDEHLADDFAEFIELQTDKEVFVDQVPVNPENWEKYL